MQKTPQQRRRSDMGGLAHGLQFALVTLGGAAVGYWLGGRLGSPPLGLITGLFAGSIIGMIILVRALK